MSRAPIIKKIKPMTIVQVRIPGEFRQVARKIANAESRPGSRVTETDVYRTAISDFLASYER